MISDSELSKTQQRELNNIFDPGNSWINGFAGSGKSVLLANAIKRVRTTEPDAKITLVVFTHSLVEMFRTGLNEIGVTNILIQTYFKFEKDPESYGYIFADELQDMPESVVSKMRTRAAKKLIFSGDAAQSIYESTPRGEPTINVGSIVKVGNIQNSLILLEIWRMTKFIGDMIHSFMPNFLSGASYEAKTQNIKPELYHGYKNLSAQLTDVFRMATSEVDKGYTTVILLPNHEKIEQFFKILLKDYGVQNYEMEQNQWKKPDYGALNGKLEALKAPFQYLGNGFGSLDDVGKVLVMTYHSSKGLDFEQVFLPMLENDFDFRTKGEVLWCVALSRSKGMVRIFHSGATSHPYVAKIETSCISKDRSHINHGHVPNGQSNNASGAKPYIVAGPDDDDLPF